jgi:uncharacterized Zn finger protein
MPKRKGLRDVSPVKPGEMASALRKALLGQTKAKLVDHVVELAEGDRGLMRQLMARFDVVVAPDDLVAATRQAIIDATAFDEREMNRNFDYDYAAYDEVKRNFGRLIGMGQLRQAMELSLELMKRGSYQVEMSDEGQMLDEIEDCLSVVVEALGKCDLAAEEVIGWCSEMVRADRVQYIATEEIQSLRGYFQSAAARREE